jgi:hypothetical protein
MKKLWMVAAATSFAFAMNAQDSEIETQAIGVVIDAHALVDVVSDEIVFDFSADDPAEAGSPFVLGSNKNQSTHLNYSLMLSNGGLADGTISVRINDMNEGMFMSLLADGSQVASLDPALYGRLGNVSANFDATAGGPSVKLTSTDQVLIENIGSSYTGNGASNGYQLFYTAHIDNYALLDADNGAQDMGTITYTIAE